MASNLQQKPDSKVSRAAIRRAVASSTAIETGQSVKVLEQKLKREARQGRRVKLAMKRSGSRFPGSEFRDIAIASDSYSACKWHTDHRFVKGSAPSLRISMYLRYA